jgi:hypothetical protein
LVKQSLTTRQYRRRDLEGISQGQVVTRPQIGSLIGGCFIDRAKQDTLAIHQQIGENFRHFRLRASLEPSILPA